MIPNMYYFKLSDGKHAVVEAKPGRFHVAHAALVQHMRDNDIDLTIEESDPWKPDEVGYRMVMSGHPDFSLVLRVEP